MATRSTEQASDGKNEGAQTGTTPPASGGGGAAGVKSALRSADFVAGMTMLEPPKPGTVSGSSVWLRGSPTTGAQSERIATFPRGTGLELASEVKSTDKAYPDWYGVAVAGKQGFMARPFVKMEQAAPATAPAAEAQSPAQTDAAGPKPDAAKLDAAKPDAGGGGSLFFSGHLLRMRQENEFKQTPKASKPLDNVLFRACLWAMQGLGVPAKEQAERAKKLQSSACNLQSFFFLDNAAEIRKQNAALDYGGFKKWVEAAMGPYFLKQFTTTWQWGGEKKRSDQTDGNMNDNSGVLKDDGCAASDSPYKKAQALLGAEGRLIRITVNRAGGWHFFTGEVKGGVLYAFDNQGDGADRSGAFDLNEVKPDTKGGRVFEHLNNNKKFRKFNVGMSDEEKQQEKDEKERKAKLAAERKNRKKKKK